MRMYEYKIVFTDEMLNNEEQVAEGYVCGGSYSEAASRVIEYYTAFNEDNLSSLNMEEVGWNGILPKEDML